MGQPSALDCRGWSLRSGFVYLCIYWQLHTKTMGWIFVKIFIQLASEPTCKLWRLITQESSRVYNSRLVQTSPIISIKLCTLIQISGFLWVCQRRFWQDEFQTVTVALPESIKCPILLLRWCTFRSLSINMTYLQPIQIYIPENRNTWIIQV